jgi:hypothetical protein
MGKEPDDRAKVMMLSKTHMFGMPKIKINKTPQSRQCRSVKDQLTDP